MPYSEKAKYKHERQKPPKEFKPSTLRTVPVSHAPESRIKEKKFPKGTKIISGELKKPIRGKKGRLRHYATQSILVPKKR